jgi:coproporphyrinogen III oxidase-like Fe-S oxidoreductase
MGYTFEAAYFGGGTPTILIDELVATIDLIEKLFGIQEISCETNPNHLNDTVLTAIKGKVKRLSVGVQSFNDKLLAQMGRLETFGTGEEILKRIQSSAGQVPTLNIDLIYNFPEYSDEILLEDIHQIIRSNADQVTFYPLMTSNSNIHKTYHRYESKSMLEKHYYDLINENISEIYQPVSAWTYARQQDVMVDEYVTKYFQYVGVGSGSFSYLGGSLYVNTFSIKDYISRIQNGLSPLSAYREFSKLAQMQYRLMMELFNLKLDVKQFSRDFSKSPHLGVWREYMFLIFSNAIQQKGDYIHVNMSKRYLMVVMMREFFNGVNRIREQSRKDLKLIQ